MKFVLFLALAASLHAGQFAPSWEYEPALQTTGHFWREHWYQRGKEHHNPGYTKRLRVNPPEVVLHPEFGIRNEAQENGLILIPAEENLFQIDGAELALEMWGGHPGTAGKRVTVNGRSTYQFPLLGTEAGHCTYTHPVFPLKIGDLVNGWNAFQFALDQGTTFWGHMMLDEACLRVALKPDHPDLAKAGLTDFKPTVEATAEGDTIKLRLSVDDPRVASVDFQGYYSGYDENGNRRETDWHGHTRFREPEGLLGAVWDTSMLAAQKNVAVRAFVRFKDLPGLVYVTPASGPLAIAERKDASVALYSPHNLPRSFWTRNKKVKTCHIRLDVAPDQIERAELLVIAWTGGPGEVKDYFTLNGTHFPVADGDAHAQKFSRLAVDPKLLKLGDNEIRLTSDTEHHGIEIVAPGPALVIRYRR